MRKGQQLQDETRYCENCGISFIWTLEEQRTDLDQEIIAEEQSGRADASTVAQPGAPIVPPDDCPGCRHLLPAPGRERGLVKWYHRRKGYGFIVRNGSADIYVNRSALRRGHLMPGELVEFVLSQNQQGFMADDVTIIESAGTAY